MGLGWLFNNLAGGVVRWLTATVIAAAFLVWGFTPAATLAEWFGSPPPWVVNPWTKLLIVAVGVVIFVAVTLSRRVAGKSSDEVSILDPHRYYSKAKKEEIAAILDKTFDTVNKSGNEIGLLVNAIMGRSHMERSSQNIAAIIEHTDRIIGLTVTMHKEFFTQLYKDHPDFPIELNTLLWPQEPLNDLQMAASQFRNAISVWGATRDSLKGAELQGLQLLVGWTGVTLKVNRDKLNKWLDKINQQVELTRRALRN